MRLLTCLSLVLTATHALCEAPQEIAKFTLENRSSFSPDRGARNPFWPIGWSPAGEAPAAPTPIAPAPRVVAVPPESLKVTTTLLGSPSLAIVNGKELTVGSMLLVPANGGEAQLRVVRIGDGYVDFDQQGKLIRATVP